MSSEEDLDELKIIEQYIILLLGVMDKPIPSTTHLQKELFFLSKANPIISNFITFQKHYFGPYSDVVDDLSRNPVHFKDPFEYDKDGKFLLIENGKEIFNKLVDVNNANENFKKMLSAMKLARKFYEKLTTDELLFLIYITYGEYIEKSHKAKELLSKRNRFKIAQQLLNKGVITKGRYLELVESQ
ncbi:MAG: hypothetical protein ACTSUT_19320 [Promethearchaeota archaeon]